MERSLSHHYELSSHSGAGKAWKIGSLALGIAATILAVATFANNRPDVGRGLLYFAVGVFCLIAAVHARFLYLSREQYRCTVDVLQIKEREFQSVFENALDTILILDGRGTCRDANPSAIQLLGVSREQLVGQSIAMFYPDEDAFRSSWQRLLALKHDRGQSEIVRADGASIFVDFTATVNFLPNRHMMVLRDITERRRAEEAKEQSLGVARSAWQEADALRKATLALTQDLRMNSVLDTVLRTLHQIVPYQAAQVLLLETDSRLFLAREAFPGGNVDRLAGCPETLDVSEHPLLRRALRNLKGILAPDTLKLNDWQPMNEGAPVRSWIGVPLVSSDQVIGLLSLAHTVPGHFSAEHLRVAGSLAVPAAVAIQNARLYERADIYGAELERRLTDLHQAEDALEQSEEIRRGSEDRFQKLFRSAPIAFAVTSLADGRYIDVNETFERRYGYARSELIGRTSANLGFWEDPQEQAKLIERLRSGVRIRGAVTRFRTSSGELKTSFYSAETLQLGGQSCLLIVSDDVSPTDPRFCN